MGERLAPTVATRSRYHGQSHQGGCNPPGRLVSTAGATLALVSRPQPKEISVSSPEVRFVELFKSWLVSLPHDLKIAFEAMDDENLPRGSREIAVGAIMYVVSPNDFVSDRNEAVASFA